MLFKQHSLSVKCNNHKFCSSWIIFAVTNNRWFPSPAVEGIIQHDTNRWRRSSCYGSLDVHLAPFFLINCLSSIIALMSFLTGHKIKAKFGAGLNIISSSPHLKSDSGSISKESFQLTIWIRFEELCQLLVRLRI